MQRSSTDTSPKPPTASSNPTASSSNPTASSSTAVHSTWFVDGVPTLELFSDRLMEKFIEGNKDVANAEQKREGDGTFGEKSFLSCSWRTWIKRMYLEHPDVVCICSCNQKPLRTGQSLIKHIERTHYFDKEVFLDDNEILIQSQE